MVRLLTSVLTSTWIGLGSSSVARAAGLEAGRPLPELKFTNIYGNEVESTDYTDWVQIYTFADQKSSNELMAWLDGAGLEAMARHPDTRFAYMGFADVTTVPDVARNLATSAIAAVDERSIKKMRESFEKRGITLDPERAAFHLTPDWDGTWLNTFQIEDAKVFYCWVVYQGKVVARYQGDTPDLSERYLADLDRILSK